VNFGLRELDAWIKTLPQPRMMAMEATIFTGWIYDHLLPHAEKVKVAHPLMLRAIAVASRTAIVLDAGESRVNIRTSKSLGPIIPQFSVLAVLQ
jgi:hypothetical protein